MEGMSSHLFFVLLCLALMFLLLFVSVEWVQATSDIDWEHAWELGPESGRPTEPEWGQGGTASF
ncbi:MAG: hypothetical protein GTN40_04950, partial [Candidatus Aenigmarchaeota archaeon]|nr:hypothetical protein [Candidatus Aenigmarchaeota archaeon]